MDTEEKTLPEAVRDVLRRLPEAQFRVRLTLVQKAAARAITRLREIELARIEQLVTSGEGSDLALWEQVAPAVGASIGDVNGLLLAIDEQFPADEQPEEEDDFDLAFGGGDEVSSPHAHDVPTTFEEKVVAAERNIQGLAQALRSEVGRFGQRVRNPSVVADRWNLLIDLQEFRGKCRAAIGELVYSSCNAFEDIPRAGVVPEYLDDVEEGLQLRQGWMTLTRAIGPLNARLQIAGPEQQRALLLAVQRELDHFRSSVGYLNMRAGDKRFVIQFAEELQDAFDKNLLGKHSQTLVEGFAKFLDSMAVLNRREVLMNHDREAFAECGILLEQANGHLGQNDFPAACSNLTAALRVATRLYGRDRHLDDHLVLRTRWPAESLIPGAIPAAIDELRTCLAESGNHAPGTIF